MFGSQAWLGTVEVQEAVFPEGFPPIMSETSAAQIEVSLNHMLFLEEVLTRGNCLVDQSEVLGLWDRWTRLIAFTVSVSASVSG